MEQGGGETPAGGVVSRDHHQEEVLHRLKEFEENQGRIENRQ